MIWGLSHPLLTLLQLVTQPVPGFARTYSIHAVTMPSAVSSRRSDTSKDTPAKSDAPASSPPKKVFNRLLEDRAINRLSSDEYRKEVQKVYDGPQGGFLMACSMLSLHFALVDRLLRTRKFDLSGARQILDVGSGAGQIARHLMRYADPAADITCFDLSPGMLKRAMRHLRRAHANRRQPRYVVADVTKLPFADGVFDCVTCGYVMEHVPDPRQGLAELARVMAPGARMLLLTTEDSFGGAWTSRVWRCRTYNRRELHRLCEELGLEWRNELWFTPMHKVFRAGGICVEIVKQR